MKKNIQSVLCGLAITILIILSSPTTASAAECLSWKWVQTGSHTECSGWFCWTVPEWSLICTEYAPEITPIPTPTPTPTPTSVQIPVSQGKVSNGGAIFTFGSSDVNRYKIFQSQLTNNTLVLRANYYMSVIANSYGFTPREFEKKYYLAEGKNE
ncbi:MAG: hypothetical protein FIB07_16985 [Candidatus Methanoperedens sp.]|nr:hypothetical protein [Candidatus Methanoperedens sp.]